MESAFKEKETMFNEKEDPIKTIKKQIVAIEKLQQDRVLLRRLRAYFTKEHVSTAHNMNDKAISESEAKLKAMCCEYGKSY